jgi:hypothetical protein
MSVLVSLVASRYLPGSRLLWIVGMDDLNAPEALAVQLLGFPHC